MNKRVELLAPAGSFDALKAAVQNGADAVYLGGTSFSARYFADNFNETELEDAARYCHLYGVRLFVTVNTLLKNRELQDALEYLLFLRNLGVDAVIVQDLGLIRAASSLLNDLELHGSTQMTLHNSAAIRFVERYGIRRVVLARELCLDDIKDIGSKTNASLEVFAHGALCISYSGQCLFSSMVGGRSGNRGRCAQPCRLPYTLLPVGGDRSPSGLQPSHLLSPRDLNVIEFLPEIIASGVSAIKIEGRMKRAEYVAVVVGVYRRALDRYYSDPGGYHVRESELQDLAQVFNREFTPGYFFGNPGRELMSCERPNNRGIFLGRVLVRDPKESRIKIRLSASVAKGDAVEIWVTRGGRTELTVQAVYSNGELIEEDALPGQLVELFLPGSEHVKKGDRVFKTQDVSLNARARETFKSPAPKRRIPLTVIVSGAPGVPLEIEGRDDCGNTSTVRTESSAEAALKRPLTEESIKKQIDRLGNTAFELVRLKCSITGQIIVPISEINRARRKMVAQLEKMRWDSYLPRRIDSQEFVAASRRFLKGDHRPKKAARECVRLSVSVGSLAAVKRAVLNGADRVYAGGEMLAGQALTGRELGEASEFCRKKGVEFFVFLPRIWHEKESSGLQAMIAETAAVGPTGFTAANLGLLELLRTLSGFKIHADYPLNIMNDQSAWMLMERGAGSFTVSPELNLGELNSMTSLRESGELLCHGSLPLMVSEHCVLGAAGGKSTLRQCSRLCADSFVLKDRLDIEFPVVADDRCRMYIYNSKTLNLIKNLDDLCGLAPGYLRIEARKDTPEYVGAVVGIYRKVLDRHISGTESAEILGFAERELEKLDPGGFTKGHYFRGVD